MVRNILRGAKQFILRNLRSLILFELFYKAVYIGVMMPFFVWGFKMTLKFAGYSYLTLENVAGFFRSPVTIIGLVILAALLGMAALVEIISLSVYYYSCLKQKKIHAAEVIFPGIIQTGHLLKSCKNWFLPFFGLFSTLVLIFPIIVGMLTRMKIPAYLLKSAMKEENFLYIVFSIFILLLILIFRGMFVFHFCGLEGMNFFEAFRASMRLQKKHMWEIITSIAVWNVILCIGYIVLYYGVILLVGFIIYFVFDEGVVVAAYLSVVDKVNLYVGIVISVITVVANYGLITRLFVRYKSSVEKTGYVISKLQERIEEEENELQLEGYGKKNTFRLPKGRYMKIITLLTIAVVCVNCIYLFLGYRNGSFMERDSLFGIYITSHRGASFDAPENTIPAMEAAISAFSDYAEIDVQETKDGVVVLLHDSSLRRTTGVNKPLWSLDYEDVLELDAGSWFSKEYAGTKIPTLEEVMQLCKGKINLNIEIKANSHSQALEEKVVELIQKYDFERQCVVTSANYKSLAKVKALNEDIRTGYIMSLAYGYFYDRDCIDFFSVKSSFINESMVKTAHSLGKEVHAWTVNSKTEIERMKQLEVDNIITDHPIRAREVIYGNESRVTSIRQLINLVIRQK